MVTRKPFGPTPDELRVIGDRAMTLESVRKYIGCGNVRRLYVEVLDDDRRTKPPSRFRITLYDDTNHRAILIAGSLRDPRRVNITESAVPPRPSDGSLPRQCRSSVTMQRLLRRSAPGSLSHISRSRHLH